MEERREIIEATPGSVRYRPHPHDYPFESDWERDAFLYNSWNNSQGKWKHQTSSSISPSMSNSYTSTTIESISGNDFNSKDDRKLFDRSQTTLNATKGIETPTAALHRRLKTFLRRHMPQDRPIASPLSSALVPTRLDQQYDVYDTGRWRR